jgi:hypothetical protein
MEREKKGIWSRRDFFTRIGWGGVGLWSFFSLVGFVRSAFPRVHFEPPTNTSRTIEFGSYVKKRASTPSLPNARISVARRDGFKRKTNSNAPVTEAAITRAD